MLFFSYNGFQRETLNTYLSMLTYEEVSKLSGGHQSIRPPLLISSEVSNDPSFGIEIKISKKEESVNQNTAISGTFSVDNSQPYLWYQVRSTQTISWLFKIGDNQLLWEFPVFFPSKVTKICAHKEILVAALEDGSLFFIDPEFGSPMLPTIHTKGDALLLKNFGGNMIVCLSSSRILNLWYFDGKNSLVSLIEQEIPIDPHKVEDVCITHEIGTNEVSPILKTSEYNLRWSVSKSAWVACDTKLPPLFTRMTCYETISDIEERFGEVLIAHDTEAFEEAFFMLLKSYLASPSYMKAVDMVLECLKRTVDTPSEYCGHPTLELYDKAMELIEKERPECVEIIQNSHEYFVAFIQTNEPQQEQQSAKIQEEQPNVIPQHMSDNIIVTNTFQLEPLQQPNADSYPRKVIFLAVQPSNPAPESQSKSTAPIMLDLRTATLTNHHQEGKQQRVSQMSMSSLMADETDAVSPQSSQRETPMIRVHESSQPTDIQKPKIIVETKTIEPKIIDDTPPIATTLQSESQDVKVIAQSEKTDQTVETKEEKADIQTDQSNLFPAQNDIDPGPAIPEIGKPLPMMTDTAESTDTNSQQYLQNALIHNTNTQTNYTNLPIPPALDGMMPFVAPIPKSSPSRKSAPKSPKKSTKTLVKGPLDMFLASPR